MLTQDTGNQVIQRWRAEYCKATIKTYRGYLHRLLRHLVECGANRLTEKMLVKVPNYGPRKIIAEGDEGQRLLATAARTPWLAAFLTIIMGHGLRFSEARRLARCHYNEHAGTITFRTKGDSENTLPVSSELAELFRTAPPSVVSTDPLISLIAGTPVARTTVYKHWHRLKKDAGVNPSLRPHDLRRTIAVQTMDATLDMRVVQALLGHKNLATTALYLEHVDVEKMRKTLREVMPIGLRKHLEQKGAYFGPKTLQN
jgi:integrase